MGSQLSLSILEIIVLMVGAITLGFTIHFFVVSRRSLNQSILEASGKPQKEAEAWKLRYFNEIEHRDEELNRLRKKLAETEENNEINTIEADENRKLNKQLKAEIETLRQSAVAAPSTVETDELRKINKQLKAELEALRQSANSGPAIAETDELRRQNKQLKAELEEMRLSAVASPVMTAQPAKTGKTDYTEQLRKAQVSLLEHNEKINLLLDQINIVSDTEQKQEELLKANEELLEKIEELKQQLSQKEKEVSTSRQKQRLSTEMTSMIDSAYNEFHVLQEKIQKLESQVNASKRISMEYEDMKEGYYRVNQDFDELKRKYNASVTENKQLLEELTDTEDKLKEASAQKQQLQKRVMHLEELNNDLQLVADANKKLETQMKRIGELESMLNLIAGERDMQAQRHTKTG
jgi:DNA repair exonuclease SbcCD ATPase subunit